MEITSRLNPDTKDVRIEIDFGDFEFVMELNLGKLKEVLSSPVVKLLMNVASVPGISVRIRRKGGGA